MIFIFTTDDKHEAERIAKSEDMATCLHDISYRIRRKFLKYNDTLTQEQYDVADEIFNQIQESINEHKINLEDL